MSRREMWFESLHLMVLAGFAVAQPLYDLLARDSAFFVIRRSELPDLLAFTAALSLVIPAGVAALPLLARLLGEKARLAVHRLLVAALVGVIALPPLKRLEGLEGEATLAVAAGLGLAAAAIYHLAAPIRTFLTLLSPVILVFPLLFLWNPAIRKIAFPKRAAATLGAALEADTPIFLLVFDALPSTSLMTASGELDRERFPGFGALAEDATFFPDATTVADFTSYAVPAILSGVYPDRSWHPSLIDYPDNLFTWVTPHYRVEAKEPITQLCPPEVCAGGSKPLGERLASLRRDLWVVYQHLVLPESMTEDLPPIAQRWKDFIPDRGGGVEARRERKLRIFSDFLASISAEEPRSLYFLHVLWPHAPYQFLPSGTLYAEITEETIPIWDEREWPTVQAFQRHLLQVGFVDSLIGRLVERLRELGLYERSLIVVTADHGVSFQPEGYRRMLTAENFQDIMPVPLLIKAPGQSGGEVSPRPAETIDILPSIADLLGVELPFAVDGVSLYDPAAPERTHKVCRSRDPREVPVEDFAATARTLERKAALFGEGEGGILHPPPYRELLGRPVTELEVLPADPEGLEISLDDPGLFENVDPRSGFIPCLVTGWARRGEGVDEDSELLVAVGGVLRAYTRTIPRSAREGLLSWSAMVAEEAFRPGANQIDIYEVVPREEGEPALRPVFATAGSEPYLGVRLGLEAIPGVGQRGFYKPQSSDGREYNWTRGDATLRVPLYGYERPTRLRVQLFYGGPRETPLKISLDRFVLFDGVMPEGEWSRTFDIGHINPGRRVVVRIESETFVPKELIPGSADVRELGVAVEGVWLLGPEVP